MGNVIHLILGPAQPKELRVIYIEEAKTKQRYSIRWPETFQMFVENIHELFPDTKKIITKRFLFKDACDFMVCVQSESTFQGLLPRHKQVAPTVDVYYVVLKKMIV